MNKKTQSATRRCIAAIGGTTATARLLGIRHRQEVQRWPRTRVPSCYVVALCNASGNVASPAELRPDIFRPLANGRCASCGAERD